MLLFVTLVNSESSRYPLEVNQVVSIMNLNLRTDRGAMEGFLLPDLKYPDKDRIFDFQRGDDVYTQIMRYAKLLYQL